jgi:hypothetical protein
VDGVRLSGNDLEPATRQQRRDAFRPLAADEGVLIAVDDDCALLDQRQALFDPVRQDRPSRRQEHPGPGGEVVAGRERDQRERLACGVA